MTKGQYKFGVGLFGVIFSIFSLKFVYAAGAADAFKPIGELLYGLVKAIASVLEPIFKYIIGPTVDVATGVEAPGLFVGKVVLLVIVFGIVYAVLKTIEFFEDNLFVLWIVSIGVAVLSIRFLGQSMIDTIIFPYSAFGIALTAGLPFVLWFLVTKDWTPIYRRISWVFFAVAFLALYSIRYDELKDSAVWIYMFTALLAILLAAFDGTLQKFFSKAQRQRAQAAGKGTALNNLNAKLKIVHEAYSNNPDSYVGTLAGGGVGRTGREAYRLDVKFLEKAIKQLMK